MGERLTRAIAAGLLHLDDPDRLMVTASALSAPRPPDPEALGERERRMWGMLFAQLLGTGRHWLPLQEALALLWAVGPWREELRQLLLLLAERADHRLHPLSWAQPIPLRVHGRVCREEVRAEVLAAYCCAEACGYGLVDGRAARGWCCWCGNTADRTAGRAALPNRSAVSALPPTRAMRASGRW